MTLVQNRNEARAAEVGQGEVVGVEARVAGRTDSFADHGGNEESILSPMRSSRGFGARD